MNNGIDRLLALRQINDERGRAMVSMAPRFLQIAQRHELGTAPKAITGFNLFQTPKPIAARMADLIRERIPDEGARILEPSAGLGRLYEPLSGLAAEWLMVEEAFECANALRKAIERAKVYQRDFLTVTADEIGGPVDAVVMNPPFKQGRDVKHILHALELVKPGGRLVSLCANGPRQNEQLPPLATHWEVLPANSFAESGTDASVALVVIDK